MESSSTVSSLLHHHVPAGFLHRPARPLLKKSPASAAASCSKRDAYGWDYGGGLVDHNMIVLRKRIHEMEMAERNYEPPSHWMEWEKQYYTSYDSDICEVVGLLQTHLMSVRPSVAIGMMALLALSVPTSLLFIMFHLMEASSSILTGIHLG